MIYTPTPKPKLETDQTTAVLDYTEAQTYLRLDGTDDQALVESLITAATKKVEDYLGVKLLNQVWSIFYDYFPWESNDKNWWDGARDGHVGSLTSTFRTLELPFGPCVSVSEFITFDESDSSQSFDSSLYSLDTVSRRPVIALKSGSTWPTRTLRPVNGVKVKATFGYGATSASVPSSIKMAIKIIVAKLYQNRGDKAEYAKGFEAPIPATAQTLLEPFRAWRF